LRLPPLRQRSGDVVLLARRFLEQLGSATGRKGGQGIRLSAEAERVLGAYDWPGNVRELRNCLERATALARGPEITPKDFPERVCLPPAKRWGSSVVDAEELVSLATVERRHILRVLSASGGQKSRAAEILGVSRKTLYRKLEEYGAVELLGAIDGANESGDPPARAEE